MGRPRTFDESAALDSAVACFWRRGYGATSVRDLSAAMGITGASLYNAFGDKKELFRRALQRYLDGAARQRIAKLDAANDPVQGLRSFFEELIASASHDDRGCLLINSALEIAPHDGELAVDIRSGLQEIQGGLRRAIKAAQARGAISRKESALELSRLLLGVVIAVLVMSRTTSDREWLKGLARPALRSVLARPVVTARRRSQGRR